MKIKPMEVLTLALVLVLLWTYIIEPNRQPQPPVITSGPTQSAPVVIEQTAAPVYDIQVIEPPAPAPTATEASRAGWQAPTVQTGNTGSHDPGRTDHRNP
jgi:hypothetical protein